MRARQSVSKKQEKKKSIVKKQEKQEKKKSIVKKIHQIEDTLSLVNNKTKKERKRAILRFAVRTTTNNNPPIFPEEYTECPECSYRIPHAEIEENYTNDPLDYFTCCTECKHRFVAIRNVVFEEYKDTFVRLCEDQTKAAFLNVYQGELLDVPLSIIWNLVYHFGPNLKETISNITEDEFDEEYFEELLKDIEY